MAKFIRIGRIIMIALILTGGFGTRLRPLTNTRPKSLLPLMNRPMISYLLDSLPDGIDKVLLAAGYRVDKLQEHFTGTKYPFEVTVIEEKEPLGTAGAIKNCEGFIPEEEELLVFNGDVICSLDIDKFVDYFRVKGGLGAIALWRVYDPSRYGVVVLDGMGRLTEFCEKPKTGAKGMTNDQFLINAGTYIFKREILDHIPIGRNVSIEKEIFPNILDRDLYGFTFDGYWIDAGTAEDYLNAHKILFQSTRIFKQNELARLLWRIRMQYPDTELHPPILFGADVKIGSGSRIGPFVCIQDDVEIGKRVKISNSVILNGSRIGDGSDIKDAVIGGNNIIGRNCRFSDFMITADDQEFADGETAKQS